MFISYKGFLAQCLYQAHSTFYLGFYLLKSAELAPVFIQVQTFIWINMVGYILVLGDIRKIKIV